MEWLVEWLIKYWAEFVFGLFISGAGLAAKFIWNTWKKEREEYVDIIKKGQEDIKKNQADILNTNEHLIQLEQKLDDRFDKIDNKIDDMQEQSKSSDLAIIRDTLLRKIRHGLQTEDTCISMADYETVTSLMAHYEKLGGNGEVHKLYKRYEQLHICPEHEHYIIVDNDEIK